MNDALLVGLCEGLGDLLRHREPFVGGDPAPLQALREVLTLDQPHGQEVRGRAVG